MRYKSPNRELVPSDTILSNCIGRSKYSLYDVTDENSVTSDDSTINDKLLRLSTRNDASDGDCSSDAPDDLLYPHPLGFSNVFDKNDSSRLGLTRFSLFEDDSDLEEEGQRTDVSKECNRPRSPHLQSYPSLLPAKDHLRISVLPYPGLSLHTVGGGSANQTALLSQHILSYNNRTLSPTKENSHQLQSNGEMDRIAHHLKSAASFSASSSEYSQVGVMDEVILQKQLATLGDLRETASRVQKKIQQMIEKEREKVKRDYKVSDSFYCCCPI
jgi:hypothetical protein